MGTSTEDSYARATARAFAGAIIFAFPLLMTMEMWWLGFMIDPLRLALFILLSFPMLVGLSYYSGFEETFEWREDVLDALTALAVGGIASTAMLALFGALRLDLPWRENLGMVAMQTVPAAIGAMLARTQLGQHKEHNSSKNEARYAGVLFMMGVGALFVAFNVAPTEEMVLIAYKMSPWHGIALVLASLLVLHAFVYAIGFAGQEDPGARSPWAVFLHFSVAGYVVALLVSLYVLWTFGRTDGMSLREILMPTVVLGFPASLGAATARLIL